MTKEDYSKWTIDELFDSYDNFVTNAGVCLFVGELEDARTYFKRRALIKNEIKNRLYPKEDKND